MFERGKQHDRDIRLVRTQNSGFQNTPMKRDTFLFGTKLGLSIMTLTGTQVGFKKPS